MTNIDISKYKLVESDDVFAFKNENTTLGFVRFNVKGEVEYIFVNDGSNDGSGEWLLKYIDTQVSVLKNNRFKLINLEKNMGKGFAVQSGIKLASGKYFLFQDADLEYDPTDIPKLINPIKNGNADVVYGSRFIGSAEKRVLFYWHSLGNKFLTTLSNMFSNLNLTDMECCYKAFKKEILSVLQSSKIGL